MTDQPVTFVGTQAAQARIAKLNDFLNERRGMSYGRRVDLGRLNSMTKYPSIPTYHAMDDQGMLQENEPTAFFRTVVVTEKIDGCNARIIMCPDGTYILGSREELLYGGGDLIRNPAHNIVETLDPVAAAMSSRWNSTKPLTVFYGEIYGHPARAGAWGNYSERKDLTGFRLFDVFTILPDEADQLFGMEREQIALWRDHGGQRFMAEAELIGTAYKYDLELVPRWLVAPPLPTGLVEMRDWMVDQLPVSRARLSPSGAGVSEGLVLRSWGRSLIAKARFADYASTLRRLNNPPRERKTPAPAAA